jgi:hypothetical protein
MVPIHSAQDYVAVLGAFAEHVAVRTNKRIHASRTGEHLPVGVDTGASWPRTLANSISQWALQTTLQPCTRCPAES